MLYIAFQSVKPSTTGVIKKILGQAEAMKETFPGFRCFVIGNHDGALLDSLNIKNSCLEFIMVPVSNSKSSLSQMVELRRKSVRAAEKIVAENAPAFLYMRYPLGCPWMLAFFKKCWGKNIKIITEHQSFEIKELIILKKYHLACSEVLFGKKCLKQASAVVGVTEEITNYQLRRVPSIRSICIPNGIDTSKYQPRNPSLPDIRERLDLLFVGALSKWHGIDRLINGISLFRNAKLHLVGEGSATVYLKKLVSEKGLERQVIFHGFKTGEALDRIFDACHIAVGSLGIHRKGLNETSELKAREYCARGIPFFSSAFDKDFPQDCPYRLKVPADERPLDLEPLFEFAERVMRDEEHPSLMREYAQRRLDWSVKMGELNEFLKELFRERNNE